MEKNNLANKNELDGKSSLVLRLFFILSVGFLVFFVLLLELNNDPKKISKTTRFDEQEYLNYQEKLSQLESVQAYFTYPDLICIDDTAKRALVRYGKELIMHTSEYLGPNGSVSKLSNGMNCQNCHLDAGTKIWGNNYGAVASTYPKMRARSGKMESIQKRINDCFERSLNGKTLRNDSREMRAMVAYMNFLGTFVKKDSTPEGTGIFKLPYLDRPADPVKGQSIYAAKCASCHAANGEGMLALNQKEFTYPPLWGMNSYNSGAGLFRLSRLAGYIKYNMPYGADFLNPQMTDADSWDVAAFINSQPRPTKDISKDWPDISKKPTDHPFGPYSDGFSEQQHKFGPFEPIEKARKVNK
jgi:thiosulfate dehydrogenase